jgi:hypothetical protein
MNVPVVLFVYARVEHTRSTVDALLNNPESKNTDLIIFSDAAKTPAKQTAVDAVRNYIYKINGFRSIKIYLRQINYGLSKSIISGVTEVLTNYESVIVLEDDMVVSANFLNYMKNSLLFFRNDDRIISIHGYMYPVRQSVPNIFFMRGADCWGWGTWRRGWALFNPDGHFLLRELKRRNLVNDFNLNGSYDYFKMLKMQVNNKNDSWAIRWHASAFLAEKLTQYPGKSLVKNIGNDGSGTHCGSNSELNIQFSNVDFSFQNINIAHSKEASKAIESFFNELKLNRRKSVLKFTMDKLAKLIMKFQSHE